MPSCALAEADGLAALDPPMVTEFATERLGRGLRARSARPVAGTVSGPVSYEWRSEERGFGAATE